MKLLLLFLFIKQKKGIRSVERDKLPEIRDFYQ